MIIHVLDRQFNTLTAMDNSLPGAIHFFNDNFHIFLESVSTLELSVTKSNPDIQYLIVGNYLQFNYQGNDYLMTIRVVDETDFQIDIEAESLTFDLLNESVGEYSATAPRSIEAYLNDILVDSDVVIGLNEVRSSTRTLSWEGDATVLERLKSIVNYFGAEFEIITELNNDRSLKQLTLNIYKEYSESGSNHGVGADRTDITLEVGKNVSSVRKKVDATEIFTSIKPTGNDGLTISSIEEYLYDSNRNLQFYTKKGSPRIYAPMANSLYGRKNAEQGGYIDNSAYTFDTDDVKTLYGNALSQLKKYCEPATTYEVEGYYELNIGDTVSINDFNFSPPLLLEARVAEMEVSFTDPAQNKTVFSNYVAFDSAISSDLLKQLEALKNKVGTVVSDVAVIEITANTAKETADSAKDTATTANNNANQAKDTANTANNTANNAANQAAAANKKVSEFEKTLNDTKDAVGALETDFADQQQALQDAVNKANEIEINVSGVLADVASINNDIDSINADISTINSTVSSVSSKANEAYSKAQAVEGKTVTLEKSVDGLTGRLTAVETTSTSTTKKLNELEVTVDGQKQTLATVQTAANSALSKANVLETTVDGVTQTLSSVEQWQTDFSVGGRNYWANSLATAGYVKTADGTFVDSMANPQHQTMKDLIPVIPKSRVLYQVWNPDKVVNSANSNRIAWFDKDKNFISVNGIPFLTGDTYQKNYYTAPANAYFMRIGVIQGDSNNVKNENMQFKFEIGTSYSDWTPAPEDMATLSKVNQVEATVDGVKTTVSSVKTTADSALSKATTTETTVNGLKTTISSVETTANSALTKANTAQSTADGNKATISSVKTTADSALSKATQTETTVNGLKTTVTSVQTTANNALTKATQVEQTASGIRQTVTEVQGNIADLVNKFPDPDFKKQNPKPTIEGTGITISYDANGLVINNNGPGSQRVYWGAAPVALTVGKTYNVKLYMNTGTAGGTVEIGSSEGENIKVTPRAGYLTWVQGTIKATTYTGFSIWVEAGKAVRLRELYIYEANTDVTSSQFTQLSDQINLKVSKGDLISQINVEAGKTLIQTGKLYLDAATVTFSGQAFIPVASIKDLTADAIKVGTLTGMTINGGKITGAEFINATEYDVSGGKLTATNTIAGKITMVWKQKTGTMNGLLTIAPDALQSDYYSDAAKSQRVGTWSLSSGSLIVGQGNAGINTFKGASLGPNGLGMADPKFTPTYGEVNLTYQDLMVMPATQITPASGFTIYSSSTTNMPVAMRNGRTIQLAGAFKNNSSIATSADEVLMGTLPVWARPARPCNFIVQGSGMNKYLLTIRPDGTVNLARYGSGSSYETIGAGSWLNIACLYAAGNM
ncbi:phage tail protein [Enterococcus gallinarum]|uniref:phage tail protein n=1 Tax=Enterococcus gallinarum TaxID=1353 RepID=UPI00115A5A51|nr:phage tail protein [Enterococcus gallinarum]